MYTIMVGRCQDNETSVEEEDEDYGKTWMYIPDGEGTPRAVNLTDEDDVMEYDQLESYVHFYFYSRRDPDNYTEIFLDSDASANEVETEQSFAKFFDPKREVKIITHGWMSSSSSPAITDIRDAYLKTGDYNIVAVDWEKLANNALYFIAARHTQIAGKKIALLVDLLIKEFDLNVNQFHLMGHSLGAHVCGFAGRNIRSGKVARITGFDPASPGFEYLTLYIKGLNAENAQFVDVIHTSAGSLGYWSELGHVDFFPNGGKAPQPGCSGFFYYIEACSHGRSYMYYAESIIYPNGFLSCQCETANDARAGKCTSERDNGTDHSTFMGELISPNARGSYYLTTDKNSPYHQNQ